MDFIQNYMSFSTATFVWTLVLTRDMMLTLFPVLQFDLLVQIRTFIMLVLAYELHVEHSWFNPVYKTPNPVISTIPFLSKGVYLSLVYFQHSPLLSQSLCNCITTFVISL